MQLCYDDVKSMSRNERTLGILLLQRKNDRERQLLE